MTENKWIVERTEKGWYRKEKKENEKWNQRKIKANGSKSLHQA